MGDVDVSVRGRVRDGDGVSVDALNASESGSVGGKEPSCELYDERNVLWERVRDGGGADGDAEGGGGEDQCWDGI